MIETYTLFHVRMNGGGSFGSIDWSSRRSSLRVFIVAPTMIPSPCLSSPTISDAPSLISVFERKLPTADCRLFFSEFEFNRIAGHGKLSGHNPRRICIGRPGKSGLLAPYRNAENTWLDHAAWFIGNER